MSFAPPIPETVRIAFKEWAGVCEALADGRQSIILRKGGIAEGPGGFQPEHSAFWLYPTHLHEAQQGLRAERSFLGSAATPADRVPLAALAVVESVGFVDRPDLLGALEPWHIWTRETVLKRFHYRQPGLWVLGVRVYRPSAPAFIGVTPEQAGCKTWVTLESPPRTTGLAPVLDDLEAAHRRDRLAAVLSAPR